jgi:DNA-directed RNA polymerase subunit RPC12/RpoP
MVRGETEMLKVSVKNIIPSHLPSFLLPCPHCGHRMVVRAVTPVPLPVPLDGDAESSDLDDITYGCVQCGTTMTRTVRTVVTVT